MSSKDTQSLIKSFERGHDEGKQLRINIIRKKVERGSGFSLDELKDEYSEKELLRVGLYYVSTTKKAICKALDIPIESACRYKRSLEKDGFLVQSYKDIICPYTNELARELSTNPAEYERLIRSNQTKLF